MAKILDIFSFQTAFSYQKIVELERSSNTFKRKKQDDEVACPKPTTDTHTLATKQEIKLQSPVPSWLVDIYSLKSLLQVGWVRLG